MGIDVKTNIYNDTKPLLDGVPEHRGSEAQALSTDKGPSDGEMSTSEFSWRKESLWSIIVYWVGEFIWRRRYWNKLRLRRDR